ncbi:MAG: Hsp20/alpha crystallin family protein [Bacteroidetes bacterium]|nr:MAG: Hsp20/alpha crystallin family protein [Bacteroidota bacterium]
MYYRNHSRAHRGPWSKYSSHHKSFHGCGGGHAHKGYSHGFWRGMFSAPVNIEELDASYELYLFAPGRSKADFKIQVTDDLLNISYKEPELVPDEAENWLHKEYYNRSFERSFLLNEKVDAENISAKYENGVLQVTMPKVEGAESSRQDILVN